MHVFDSHSLKINRISLHPNMMNILPQITEKCSFSILQFNNIEYFNQIGSKSLFFLEHCKKLNPCIKNSNVNVHVPTVAIFKVITILHLPIRRSFQNGVRPGVNLNLTKSATKPKITVFKTNLHLPRCKFLITLKMATFGTFFNALTYIFYDVSGKIDFDPIFF